MKGTVLGKGVRALVCAFIPPAFLHFVSVSDRESRSQVSRACREAALPAPSCRTPTLEPRRRTALQF